MKENANILVGKRLETIIRHYDLTPNEFSKRLGFDRADKIYNILKGKFLPSFEILNAITNKFVEINLTWLITGDGKMLYKKNDEPANIAAEVRVQYEADAQCLACIEKDRVIEIQKIALDAQKGEIEAHKGEIKALNQSLNDKERLIQFLTNSSENLNKQIG